MKYLQTDGVEPTLHTQAAKYLIIGGPGNHISLFEYSKCIDQLYRMSKADDPYSQWYILRCYRAIAVCQAEIEGFRNKLDEHINKIKDKYAINISTFVSPKPFKKWLRFSHEASYQCVTLIAAADYIYRHWLILRKTGVPLASKNNPQQIKNKIVEVFDLALRLLGGLHQFKVEGSDAIVTRKDIFENNERAKLIKEKLGAVPDDVLYKKITFMYLPELQGEISGG